MWIQPRLVRLLLPLVRILPQLVRLLLPSVHILPHFVRSLLTLVHILPHLAPLGKDTPSYSPLVHKLSPLVPVERIL